MLNFIYNFLQVLFPLTLVAAAAVAFIYRRKKELRIVGFYLFYNLLAGLLFLLPESIQSALGGKTFNFVIFNIDVLVDVALIYWYVRTLLIRNSLRVLLIVLFCLFACICLYLWIFTVHCLHTFYPTLYGIGGVFMTLPCFFYFYELFRSELTFNLKRNPHFYIVVAIFLCYGITMPFYFGYKTLYGVNPKLNHILIDINSFIFICFFSVIMYAFWMKPEKTVDG